MIPAREAISCEAVRASDRQADSGSQTVRVSFICTANRARSPFAAALLRRHSAGLPVVVDSFGTLEQRGAPALPQAIRTARSFGIDLIEHRARLLGTGQLAGSDLVIGFEPFHVAHAVVTGGVPRSRAFLLAELARALDDSSVQALRDVSELCALVARVEAVRTAGHWLPVSIPDPVGGSDRRFLETYEEIERIIATIARRLFGTSA